MLEYYDLPYRYNETVVKILYQTPTILFVYWDISDFDRENYIKRPKMANLTQLILVISSKNPVPDLLMLDKQLAFSEFLDVKPIIVINKMGRASGQCFDWLGTRPLFFVWN